MTKTAIGTLEQVSVRSVASLASKFVLPQSYCIIMKCSDSRSETLMSGAPGAICRATAIVTRRQLVTSDRKILRWATGRTEPDCLDART